MAFVRQGRKHLPRRLQLSKRPPWIWEVGVVRDWSRSGADLSAMASIKTQKLGVRCLEFPCGLFFTFRAYLEEKSDTRHEGKGGKPVPCVAYEAKHDV